MKNPKLENQNNKGANAEKNNGNHVDLTILCMEIREKTRKPPSFNSVYNFEEATIIAAVIIVIAIILRGFSLIAENDLCGVIIGAIAWPILFFSVKKLVQTIQKTRPKA